MKKLWLGTLVGMAVAGFVLALLSYLASAPGSENEVVEVSVPAGYGVAGIGRELEKAGAVRSAWAFRIAATLKGEARHLKAGEYEIPRHLSAAQVVDYLVSGKALQRRVTMPEGLSAYQMGQRLADRKLADAAVFLKLALDPAEAKKRGVNAPSLEGFLFPDSYQFARGLPESQIIDMMLARFREKVPDKLLAKGAALGLRPLQVLTLASLIEKEARAAAERPKVARVFLNRKIKKMRLESCATVRYALNKYRGPIYFKDLDVVSRYNTYRHAGLPPGPIASPGLASIEAAVAPDDGDWLFFVVSKDGQHHFSKNFEEHKKAKFDRKRGLRHDLIEEEAPETGSQP